jgi:hypothetical protein
MLILAAFEATNLIAPAIGIVGIAVSVYLWRRSRVRKAISYRLTSPAVVNVHREVEDRISVHYENERVGDVRLLDLRVTNTGNKDVSPDDFAEPFVVALGEGARVLGQPTILKTEPPDLRPQVSIEKGSLVIAPLLMNEGDSFEITALISDLREGDRLRARIAGIPKLINEVHSETQAYRIAGMRLQGRLIQATSIFALGASLLIVIFTLFPVLRPEPDHRSLVVIRTGGPLCGDVLRVDSHTIVVKLKGSGTLRTLPLNTTRAIKDNAC